MHVTVKFSVNYRNVNEKIVESRIRFFKTFIKEPMSTFQCNSVQAFEKKKTVRTNLNAVDPFKKTNFINFVKLGFKIALNREMS